MVPQSKLDSMK